MEARQVESPLQTGGSEVLGQKIIGIVEDMPTLNNTNTVYVSTKIPMRIWLLAGLCSISVKAATIVNWIVMGVNFTRELVLSMKKSSHQSA